MKIYETMKPKDAARIFNELELEILLELLRRMLYAFGGDGNVAVTRAEAEVLFDINDATADAEPNPAWTDLFVKAIANVVMAASGQQPPNQRAYEYVR